jgi:hypothetical protein
MKLLRPFSTTAAAALATALFVAAGSSAAAETTPPSDFGVLVMAHGGPPEWNRGVLDAVAPLAAEAPLEVAFGMADACSLQAATRKLEARGVRRIAVVRLFVSGESWYERTEQILGLRDGAPALPTDGALPAACGAAAADGHAGHGTPAVHTGHATQGAADSHGGHGAPAAHAGHASQGAADGHSGHGAHGAAAADTAPPAHGATAHGAPAHGGAHTAAASHGGPGAPGTHSAYGAAAAHGGHTMELFRLQTQATFALSREGLLDAPEMGDILAERARGLSRDPQREDVLILAHGPEDDGENERWLQKLDARAEAVRAALPFHRVQVETLREDWPEKRVAAEERVRTFVAAAAAEGRGAIVIPYRLFGFGPFARVLEGHTYAADQRGLLPHVGVTDWLRRQVAALRVASFRAPAPAETAPAGR